jgi:hypothetical protein
MRSAPSRLSELPHEQHTDWTTPKFALGDTAIGKSSSRATKKRLVQRQARGYIETGSVKLLFGLRGVVLQKFRHSFVDVFLFLLRLRLGVQRLRG